MAGLFGNRGNGLTTSTPVYTGIQVQTSSQSLPIPIIWGQNRLAPNLIDYFGFYSQPADKGKGGKQSDNDYFAAVALALCEGATAGYTISINQVWNGQSLEAFSATGFGLYPGTEHQAEWSSAFAVGHTVTYSYTAYLANGNLALGESATVPAFNFEVKSTFSGYHTGSGGAGTDANFGDIIPDFLTNPRYGVGFNADLLDGFSTLTTYHLAQGIFVSPYLKDQEQVTSVLQRWATLGNFWIFWSGTALKCVCLGDSTLTANGVTYTPNTTPIYDLGPDDFVVADKNANKNDPPITVTRKDPADCYNIVQLDCAIRGNHYETTPYIWQDQASIDAVGIQSPNVVSATEVANGGTAAVLVSLIGLRQLYIRNTYKCKLLPTFILLEPGDIVSLTEPNIGLSTVPVRVLTVDEDDKGILAFTAEEFPGTLGTAVIQEFEPWAGSAPFDTGVSGGSVNPPAFVTPPTVLTQGLNQIWVATSGGAEYGGCGIFVSFDDINYTQIGENGSKSLQGTLTAALALATGLDEANTLEIDLTESTGVIPATATDADAAAYRTLCLVDEELLAYGSVTPTGDYTANLTYLERGLYGTSPASHSPGAPFARIDQTVVFAYNVPTTYAGQTIYFKFPTVNVFGNAAQTLDECTAYSYEVAPPAAPTGLAVTYNYGINTVPQFASITLSWVVPANQSPTSYNVRWSKYPAGTSGQTYGGENFLASAATFDGTRWSITIPTNSGILNGDGYLYVALQAVTGTSTSAWTADAYTAAPTGLAAAASYNSDGSLGSVVVSWTPPATAPTGYLLQPGDATPLTITGAAASYAVPASVYGSADPTIGDYAGLQSVFGLSSSVIVTAEISGTAPLPPLIAAGTTGGFTATGQSGGARLAWNAPSVNSGQTAPTFYRVFYWQSGDFDILQYIDIAAPTSSYVVGGLTSGQWNYSVVTYNAAGTADTFDSGGPVTSPHASATAT